MTNHLRLVENTFSHKVRLYWHDFWLSTFTEEEARTLIVRNNPHVQTDDLEDEEDNE